MPWQAKLYITLVAIPAAVIVLALFLSADAAFGPVAAFNVGLFVVVAIFAELLAIDFRIGRSDKATSSSAFLPFLASFVLFEPIFAVAIVATATAITQFVLRRNAPGRALFNISQAIVSSAAGAFVYALLAGDQSRFDIHWTGFIAAATAFFTLNIILSSIWVATLQSRRLTVVLGKMAGPRGSNLLYDLMASPIALLPVGLYDQYNVGGLLVVVLPLLLIRHSYLSKLQLESANKDLLKVLVKAIETRDLYTSGHSMRVATLAQLVATDIGLRRRTIEIVETAALLHDIGKIDSMYEAVIKKPHDLTTFERALIRTHATRGADLLESLSSVHRDVVNAVRHHHEHYDGTGYPDGLAGDHIPVAARIIMLCDAVDAMLSDRPYRAALSIEKTRLELMRCAGTQFDPLIVRLVLAKNTLERAATLAGSSSQDRQTESVRLVSNAG